jgi:hypothetical protein
MLLIARKEWTTDDPSIGCGCHVTAADLMCGSDQVLLTCDSARRRSNPSTMRDKRLFKEINIRKA